MRVLCLDVGDKKIGMALSDPSCSIAQGLKVYRRVGALEDLAELRKIVQEHEVKEIVLGLPKNLNGTIGERGKGIIQFAEKVKEATHVPIVLWDERFSTNEANRIFEMAQVSHKKRKPFIDIMASQIILQGYLDGHREK